MTDREMIEVLRERGYRVIRAENIWTFFAQQLIAPDLEDYAQDDLDMRREIVRVLEFGLGKAIADKLREQLKLVRTYDKDLRAYCYRTELTVVKPI